MNISRAQQDVIAPLSGLESKSADYKYKHPRLPYRSAEKNAPRYLPIGLEDVSYLATIGVTRARPMYHGREPSGNRAWHGPCGNERTRSLRDDMDRTIRVTVCFQ